MHQRARVALSPRPLPRMESNLLRASALVVFGSILGLYWLVSPTQGFGRAVGPTCDLGLEICDRLRGRWLALLAALGEEIVGPIVGRGGLYRDIRGLGVSRYEPPRPTIG